MSLQVTKVNVSEGSGIVTSAGTILEESTKRQGYYIQNLGTNPLFVKEGSGASTSDFTYILAAATGADDGTGGSYESPAGITYMGKVSIAGTSPRAVATSRHFQAS